MQKKQARLIYRSNGAQGDAAALRSLSVLLGRAQRDSTGVFSNMSLAGRERTHFCGDVYLSAQKAKRGNRILWSWNYRQL